MCLILRQTDHYRWYASPSHSLIRKRKGQNIKKPPSFACGPNKNNFTSNNKNNKKIKKTERVESVIFVPHTVGGLFTQYTTSPCHRERWEKDHHGHHDQAAGGGSHHPPAAGGGGEPRAVRKDSESRKRGWSIVN